LAGQITSLREQVRDQVRESLMVEIRNCVASTAQQLVEDEVHALVGEPWSRKGDSPLRRNGRTTSPIYLDGQPCLLRRARVRDQDRGTEVPLRTLQALASRDALDIDVKRLLVQGVSTRNYDAALSTLADGLGFQKSAVSAAFVRASQKDLDALNGRLLSEWTFAVIYIDGIAFADHACVVALGITTDGTKRILGVREGATENAELVKDLLSSLQERSLVLTQRTLFVLDGAKALRKAVRSAFGERALVQRCVLHKLRNVLSYLPPKWGSEVRRRLNAAWNMNDYAEAERALLAALDWLRTISDAAAASLEEGFEETLTVHRLGIKGALRRTLVTTNPIESPFDLVRTHARRVKRWNGSAMVLRWIGSGLVRAERRFRRVKGHRALPQLVAALEHVSLNTTKDVT
jgi:transposase-like protein